MGRHFSQRDHVCDKCGAAFHAKTTLEEHIIYKHTDVRNFQCDDCTRAFKTSKALKKHKKVHADLKEHKCAYCNVGFNRLYNLRHHMRAVHGNDDPLPLTRKVGLVDVPAEMMFMKGSTAVAAREKGLLLASGELNPTLPVVKEEKQHRRRKKNIPMTQPEHSVNPPELLAPGDQYAPVAIMPQMANVQNDPTLQTDGSRLYRCLLTPASYAQVQSQGQPQSLPQGQPLLPQGHGHPLPLTVEPQAMVASHPQHLEAMPTPINYVLPYNVHNQ